MITLPPDSQEEASVHATSPLNSPETHSTRAADAQAEPTVTTAAPTDPVDVGAVTTSSTTTAMLTAQPPASRAVALEQHRDTLMQRRRDSFDHAEQSAVDAEQARLLARAANNSVQPSGQQSDTRDVSETERGSEGDSSDSSDSGPSEDSEEEYSDADTNKPAPALTADAKDSNTQQQSVPAPRELRSHTKAKLADQTTVKAVTAADKPATRAASIPRPTSN